MISEYLQVVNIMMNLDSKDQDSTIDHMVYLASRNNYIDNLDDLMVCLKKREAKKSTGFGKGVAIPHAFSEKTHNITISVAILKNPVEWGSVDNKPVNLLAMISAPARFLPSYMKILLRMSKVLANDTAREKILAAPNCQTIFDTIDHYDRVLNNAG